jgi:phage shock protein PspC (stress-responsive transcriptional regulator)
MNKYHTFEKKLTRDSVHEKITGVCAGIARHYGLPRVFVRIAAVLCLVSLPVVTCVAYVAATLLLPSKCR